MRPSRATRSSPSQWAAGANADIEHIALASSIDLLLVAPATANIIGKFADGIADDFLSALYLATRAPVLVAPAMNTNMLEHPAVRQNLAHARGARRAVRASPAPATSPAAGWARDGSPSPTTIVEAADRLLRGARSRSTGRRVLVTAGPTYEDLDPVRFHRQPIERADGVRRRRRGAPGVAPT